MESNTELIRSISSMKFEHETTPYANLVTPKIVLHPTNEKLSSSSAGSSLPSPDSPLDGPFHDDNDEDDEDEPKIKLSSGGPPTNALPSMVDKNGTSNLSSFHNDDDDDDDESKLESSDRMAPPSSRPSTIEKNETSNPSLLHNGDDDKPKLERPLDCGAPPSFMPSTVEKNETSHSGFFNASSATEAPPNQVMENPCTSTYKIPPSVFARSPSSTPMEWSTASNESLFSIHTGNMSFTNNHFLWRSGELGATGEVSTSDQMFSYSGDACGDIDNVADMRSQELGLAEATMKEVIKESEGQSYRRSPIEVCVSRHSQGSSRSNQSFAFSIATDKGVSTRISSSVRANHELAHCQPQMVTTTDPQPSAASPVPRTTTTTKNVAQSKWFGWLPRCSLCL